MVYLERFTKVKDPGRATPIFVPDELPPASAVGPQPPPTMGPRQAPPGPIQAIPGVLYRASVDIKFPLSVVASVSKAQAEAIKRGFANVSVTTSRPAGWPGASASYYVTGTYMGPPKFMERSEAGGQAKVVDAWLG